MTIPTVLVDDHRLVRQALRLLLQSTPDLEVVAEAADGLEALALVAQHRPRVLVVDVSLPGLSGLGVVRRVAREWPGTACVVLSMHANEAYVSEALQGGAHAYVLKEADADELLTAIRRAAVGKRYLSTGLSERAARAYGGPGPRRAASGGDPLSVREQEVLLHTVSGATSTQVAARLFISARTVEKHRENVMRKLGVRSQRELVLYAVARGLLPGTVAAA